MLRTILFASLFALASCVDPPAPVSGSEQQTSANGEIIVVAEWEDRGAVCRMFRARIAAARIVYTTRCVDAEGQQASLSTVYEVNCGKNCWRDEETNTL